MDVLEVGRRGLTPSDGASLPLSHTPVCTTPLNSLSTTQSSETHAPRTLLRLTNSITNA